ncbi:RagB/SusD family nutrient uptake outer membrane protein [Empedobacter brevis]|uniref:RagB/SusD family nutrient uptake outer membrane protein n=1 Tax=Empedobacter brevis TaxID=247 RepID=UPI00123DB1F0|nr:RagB/SusD family nutrient uptake outer membrane protein [Empedobacter brevis]QES91704.1 RagB/SusD family nutrient uptake outer membrane protein [Empedobacter brevis]
MKLNIFNINKIALIGIFSLFTLTSCHDDLNLDPIDPDMVTENEVFSNSQQAKAALGKIYASLSLTGQEGPAGQPDIVGVDEGTSQYTRLMFYLNELTTDEAIVGWGDAGLPNLHAMDWGASNPFVEAMYFRLAQTVSFSNSFIEKAERLAETDQEVKKFVAEARFIRAYAYYNLMDLFANVPLVTKVSLELPKQNNRQEIYTFVESELKDLETLLAEPRTNEYGRVDKVAAYALLSRLYLNSEVYISQNKYKEAAEYSKKAIESGYILNTIDKNNNGTAYDELFLADNNTNGAQNENIFAINFDGRYSTTYGGATFIVKSKIGGSMAPADFGVNGGWGGPRTTKALVNQFSSSVSQSNSEGNPTSWRDKRAMFHSDGQTFEIENVSEFKQGYAITKFSNKKSDGTNGNNDTGEHADVDIPIFRVAEMYLNYAEAALRGGGDTGIALGYVNKLRERAYGNTSGNVTSINLDFILAERSREMYWEGTRRIDLIRFNRFTSNYNWPFKGGITNGMNVDNHRTIYPIPFNALAVNSNLTQNPGY